MSAQNARAFTAKAVYRSKANLNKKKLQAPCGARARAKAAPPCPDNPAQGAKKVTAAIAGGTMDW